MKTVAIVGGGAAGMGAAWGLAKAGWKVVLIEAESAIGGHCLAARVPLPDGGEALVDVGVSDFNRATFANVGALFDELGLEYRPIGQDASFMRPDGTGVLHSKGGVLHCSAEVADPARLEADVGRFRLECMEVLEDETYRDMTLAAYVAEKGYGADFRDIYLYPRAQGSFPMPDCHPGDYLVRALVAFWRIHGIAGPGPADRNVLVGGMHSYGAAFTRWLEAHGGEVQTGARVVGVARRPEGPRVRIEDAAGAHRTIMADQLVLAVPANVIVPLLEDASQAETQAFSGFAWQRARVVVHRDPALMPQDRATWGAYNYVLNVGGQPEIRPTISFYPKKLAGLPLDDVFVTVNPFREPDPALVIDSRFMLHPAAAPTTEMSTARVAQLQGIRGTWFCGGYLRRPWVHEPALASGAELAERMLHRLGSGADDGLLADDFLASVPLFKGLDPVALGDLRMAAERFAVEAGGVLFRQGDKGDGLYLIQRGLLAVEAKTPGDDAIVMSEIKPGEMVGEFSLLDGASRSASVTALQPTNGLFLSAERFAAMRADGRPAAFETVERVRTEVARRVRATLERMAQSPPCAPSELRRAGQIRDLVPDTAHDAAAMLRGLLPFAELGAEEIRALANLGDRFTAARGTRLLEAGAAPGPLYIVLRGAIRTGIDRPGGIEQVAVHGPGALVGLVALVDGGEQPLSVDTVEDAILLRIGRRNFEALRKGYTALAHKLFGLIGRLLVRELRRANRHRARGAAIARFNAAAREAA